MSRTKKAPKESSAKRLRAVFYRLWEKDQEGYDDFEPYYDSKMWKLITYYKKML